jgi:hypothetical protein
MQVASMRSIPPSLQGFPAVDGNKHKRELKLFCLPASACISRAILLSPDSFSVVSVNCGYISGGGARHNMQAWGIFSSECRVKGVSSRFFQDYCKDHAGKKCRYSQSFCG